MQFNKETTRCFEDEYFEAKRKEFARNFMSKFTICMPCNKIPKYINACVECGMDIGDSNPRQYCGKFKCLF
jgi:hypothetical protein